MAVYHAAPPGSSNCAWLLLTHYVVISLGVGAAATAGADTLSYSRDVLPILARHCFACHGPDGDAREGNLRLDRRHSALNAIAAHKPDDSALIERITEDDEELRMPPRKTGRRLSGVEVEVLRRWIAEGAVYDAHWAFTRPLRPDIPAREIPRLPVGDASIAEPPPFGAESSNPIDHFTLTKLVEAGIAPSPPAERAALLRRVTLDLAGLPPSPEEVDAFLRDNSPTAYERVVDRLLASPRYGEHMATAWLDLARYADTHGYSVDTYRTMWQWRDWVIRALNANMPFDQFTIEQIAGDLLPNPSHEQLIATAFNRNHPIQLESGSTDEEFRVENVADRVHTTGAAWLGLTLQCARCHDHKFDPISQKDYYRFYAFFNNIDEQGVPSVYRDERSHRGNYAPVLATPEAGLQPEQNEAVPVTPSVMIMRERTVPRITQVLNRGAYDDPQGEPLTPGLPKALGSLPDDVTPNRLALARWITSSENPLTARVVVNRYWQHFFGVGLVDTSEDFGVQGSRPTHSELLDWLAREFVDSGWNVKQLHRLIVLSATYRQSSKQTEWHRQHDPANLLLSRGPSQRLSAETIRDSALFASGLLVEMLGGPPVRPYQPEGLWAEASYLSERQYSRSVGESLYRRSIYTFRRRTIPPPALEAFDSPTRDVCVVRRADTNTPLQSLVLLNDPTFVEASRVLAEQVRSGPSSSGWIESAYRRVLSRSPQPEELNLLEHVYRDRLAEFHAQPSDAAKLLGIGESPVASELSPQELAASALVVRIIFNLDEAITKR